MSRRSRGLRLAFDTSGPVGSVAVGEAERVLAGCLLDRPTEHASALVPAIDRLLASCGAGPRDVSEVVVGEGPGSFTGVRVAGATAKGLASALRVPLRPVCSLLAAAVAADAAQVSYVLFDARGDRVYGACYEAPGGAARTLVAPHPGVLPQVLQGEVPVGAVFVGDGAVRHRAAIEAAGFVVHVPAGPERSPAEGLLAWRRAHPDVPPVADPSAWEPLYVRSWSPEVAWSA